MKWFIKLIDIILSIVEIMIPLKLDYHGNIPGSFQLQLSHIIYTIEITYNIHKNPF